MKAAGASTFFEKSLLGRYFVSIRPSPPSGIGFGPKLKLEIHPLKVARRYYVQDYEKPSASTKSYSPAYGAA